MTYMYSIAGVAVKVTDDFNLMSGAGGFSSFQLKDMMEGDAMEVIMAEGRAGHARGDVYFSTETGLWRLEYSYDGTDTYMDIFRKSDNEHVGQAVCDHLRHKSCITVLRTGTMAVRLALWEVFGLNAVCCSVLPIHSSAIVRDGAGILFLGESGVGKSTQSSFWQNAFKNTFLLNDDSPVVRVTSSDIMVSGSPWGGKAAIFLNETYPVKAMVRLGQSDSDKVAGLDTLQSIAALLPSFSPAVARHPVLSRAFNQMLGKMVSRVGVYRMECRKDPASALLCEKTIYAN